MTHRFPPDQPFTAAEARTSGVSPDRLRALVGDGVVTQLFRGVYVPGWWIDTPANRARAAAHVLPPHCVVADRSAAWLHGIDVLDFAELDVPPALEVVSIGGATSTRRSGILGGKRALTPEDIVTIDGVAVTSPARTALDIACLRGRHRAFGALEAFRTKFGLGRSDLVRLLPRFAGRRGVIQARELVSLARAGADSQPESWLAIDLHDEGYPMPAAQTWVPVAGWGIARVENAYEHLRIGVEYDGEENHSTEEDRAHDADRREALACAAGWKVIVVRRDGFGSPGRERWLEEFSAAYAERAPYPPPRRIYSRGPDQRPRRRR